MFSEFIFLLVSLQFPACVPAGQCDSFAVSHSSANMHSSDLVAVRRNKEVTTSVLKFQTTSYHSVFDPYLWFNASNHLILILNKIFQHNSILGAFLLKPVLVGTCPSAMEFICYKHFCP